MNFKDAIKLLDTALNADTILQLKSFILALEKENRELKAYVRELESKNSESQREILALRNEKNAEQEWSNTKVLYEPYKTVRGAIVYRSIKDIAGQFLVCPRCFNGHTIMILQPDPDLWDRYICPDCHQFFLK